MERAHDLGQLTPGYLADVIAVPGGPTEDISMTTEASFAMKGRPGRKALITPPRPRS